MRVRPGRGSRPRSRLRPRHDEAVDGRVITVDRGRFTVRLDSPGRGPSVVGAVKARELGRRGIAVGDRVALVGDLSGGPDSLARIVRLHERTSVLRRTADDTDPVERVLVANADQLVVVVALADPQPQARLIDRCLVAAYDAGLEPLLCLTKADLASPDELLATYAALDPPYVVTTRGEEPAALREHLRDRVSVLVGSSGVGKSTLVNALVPGTDRETGVVNAVTGRGRHTSSSAVALELPEGGWVIDTPGVRSFGLAHVTPDRILSAFTDLLPGTAECPRGCTHDEPDCGLDQWVAGGHADPARLDSLRRLLSVPQRGDEADPTT
ncbi:ribosome small subunit-dependent GTPase A [Sporichthya polymorpha]|uniref:ribosome small subunit-dependent GTPase A n=1 Tax=Sporichthya polymorpha TaxID=35751 RepID=UPI0003748813|nr:ribosome small subunit-dependent GTPase A [Sporichthya polymorpha]